MYNIRKPIYKGKYWKWLGKIRYITFRYYNWIFTAKYFSKQNAAFLFPNSIISHSSTLLSTLKDVDMFYQHNKIRNRKLAIAQINKNIIHPEETFLFQL